MIELTLTGDDSIRERQTCPCAWLLLISQCLTIGTIHQLETLPRANMIASALRESGKVTAMGSPKSSLACS